MAIASLRSEVSADPGLVEVLLDQLPLPLTHVVEVLDERVLPDRLCGQVQVIDLVQLGSRWRGYRPELGCRHDALGSAGRRRGVSQAAEGLEWPSRQCALLRVTLL
jgi:hypothetical protein